MNGLQRAVGSVWSLFASLFAPLFASVSMVACGTHSHVEAPSKRLLKKSFTSLDGQQTVWYWEYLPPDYDESDENKTYPLLVFFHGRGENGKADGSELDKVKLHGPPKHIARDHDMCFDTPSGRQCFIVVSPQNGRPWWDPNDTTGMLVHALKNYRVDPSRIYVTGLSMGGGATWNLASSLQPGLEPPRYWSARIAAIAPVAGSSDPRRFETGICGGIVGEHLPVWAFHGSADPIVPVTMSHDWVDRINNGRHASGYQCEPAQPPARLTVYPGVGHDSWSVTYDPAREVEPGKNIYQWLLSHTRSRPQP